MQKPIGKDSEMQGERREVRHSDGTGDSEERVKSALCLSGGGIRSATFCLGVLQGLAKTGWLKEFDFLSTVSGGGYIGSWLTRWRKKTNINVVASALERSIRQPIPEIEHLRAHSSYLSPQRGLSGDVLALVGSFARNLLLNWLVLAPLLALATVLPLAWNAFAWGVRDLSLPWAAALVAAAAFGAVLAVAYATSDIPSGGPHQTKVSYFGRYWLLPMAGACLFLSLAGNIYLSTDRPVDLGWSLGVSALVGLAIWFLGSFLGAGWRQRREMHPAAVASLLGKGFRRHVGLRGAFWATVSGGISGALAWLLLAAGNARWGGGLSDENELAWMLTSTLSVPALLLILQLGTALYVALALGRNEEGAREWWGRATGYSIAFALLWVLAHVLLIWLPAMLLSRPRWGVLAGAAIVAGLVSTLGGYFGKPTGHTSDRATLSLWRVLSDNALQLAAGIFALALLISISAGWIAFAAWASSDGSLSTLERALDVIRTEFVIWAAGLASTLALVAGTSHFVRTNRFSLQAIYQNRLVRAYLGASRRSRRPHAFTGFDPDDDIPMRQASKSEPLLHVINATLNIGSPSREQLRWQERKAALFTFEAERCTAFLEEEGCEVPTKRYAGQPNGISLGRAMALSGAAASPNMGFHTSPLVSFALTFLNVRLGAWLPNPKRRNEEELMNQSEPRWSLATTLAELFGQTTSESRFVYLSDGGHFENLGLYEMVRRGCRRILVVDAGADPQFEFDDLENAVRKIRTDLGVDIEFEKGLPIAHDGTADNHLAVGTIRYGPDDVGELLYLKPVLTGDEPTDVLRYAARSARQGKPFPHHATYDQFFDEAQFESYRALGCHSIVAPGLPDPGSGAFVPEGLSHTPKDSPPEELPPGKGGAPATNLMDKLKTAFGNLEKVAKASGIAGKVAAATVAVLAIPSAAYYFSSSPQYFILYGGDESQVVLPTAEAATLYGFDANDRVVLPLFAEAQGCQGVPKDPRSCRQGVRLTKVGRRLIGKLAARLTDCAEGSSGFTLSATGFASSSDLDGGRPDANLDLADERACNVLRELSRLRLESAQVQLKLNSWNPDHEAQPWREVCELRSRTYPENAFDNMQASLVEDLVVDPEQLDIKRGEEDFDRALAVLNRRVDLTAEPGFGRCAITDIVSDFGVRIRAR